MLQNASKLFDQALITPINFTTAARYCQSRPKYQSLRFHLKSLNSKLYHWQRSDSRVSKDVLHVTFFFTEPGNLTITNSDENKTTKIGLAYHQIAGAKINEATDTIAIHYRGAATVKEKVNSEHMWSSKPASNEATDIQPLSLHLVEKKYNLEILKTASANNTHLAKALENGISSPNSYALKSQSHQVEDPAAMYPILVDPTLVRAVQLADLELLAQAKQEDQDVKWILRQFYGLDKMFKNLLRLRTDLSTKREE